MKYAVVKVVNGNFSIHAEGFTNLDSAKTNYHSLCASLWNTSDVITASVMIVDENLSVIYGYSEKITHATTEE